MTEGPGLPPEEEKAAEIESYGGVPMSEEELGRVWSDAPGEPAGPAAATTGDVAAAGGTDAQDAPDAPGGHEPPD